MIIEVFVRTGPDPVSTLAGASVELKRARDALAERGRRGRQAVAVYGPVTLGGGLAYRVTDENVGRKDVWNRPVSSQDTGAS